MGGKQIWYTGVLGNKRCLPKSKILVHDNDAAAAVLPSYSATIITWLCTDSSEEICWENDAKPVLGSILINKPFGVAGSIWGPTTTPYCVAENFVIE